VQPFVAESDYERMIDYFHGADESLLRAMGVDRPKMPTREVWLARLLPDLLRPAPQKQTYYLSWLREGAPVGHSNANQIVYGEQAFVHLHLWHPQHRQGGMGQQLFRHSLSMFIAHLVLRRVICEPYAENPAPNRVLENAGFRLVRRYRTTPGLINFEQEVNRWELEVAAD
jgi:RimJ/RimL family protein N-acetyltransferase